MLKAFAEHLQRRWYAKSAAWAWIFAPLMWLFMFVALLRRVAFARGWKKSTRLPCVVIVVGNITVGGTGKTPLCLALAQHLRAKHIAVGIISRGHGGKAAGVREVLPDADAKICGDEPVLLARRAACPVFIGARRVQAAQALLAKYPQTQVILSDDGLQHYALQRDLELALLDGARGLGNGQRLPVGALREAASRLNSVDAVIVQTRAAADNLPSLPKITTPRFSMQLQSAAPYRVFAPKMSAGISEFFGQNTQALAGIGNPQRFFQSLRHLGLSLVKTQAFADHHDFCAEDLRDFSPDLPLFVTEKDAVKLQKLSLAVADNLWALPVTAHLDAAFWAFFEQSVAQCLLDLNGAKTDQKI